MYGIFSCKCILGNKFFFIARLKLNSKFTNYNLSYVWSNNWTQILERRTFVTWSKLFWLTLSSLRHLTAWMAKMPKIKSSRVLFIFANLKRKKNTSNASKRTTWEIFSNLFCKDPNSIIQKRVNSNQDLDK